MIEGKFLRSPRELFVRRSIDWCCAVMSGGRGV